MTTFSDFALGAPILKALADEGYSTPTPIQAQAIPSVLAGRDLCGIAQTGTGKTAAFALPILQRLARPRDTASPRAPARAGADADARAREPDRRELPHLRRGPAAAAPPSSSAASSQRPQVEALRRGVDILVATPGRLLDLSSSGTLTLGAVEILVLDEADQMLDLGFIVPLRRIVKLVPQKRQTLFFSATMPKTIAAARRRLLTDPVQVAVTPVATTVERVEQSVMFVDTGAEAAAAARRCSPTRRWSACSSSPAPSTAPTRSCSSLDRAGIEAAAIHGNKSQAQRERALAAFKAGAHARAGRDRHRGARHRRRGVSHVVNYDLPNVPESYVHRIGRTARAGAAGIAHLVLQRRGARLPARHREADAAEHPGRAAAGRLRRPSAGRRAASAEPQRNRGAATAAAPATASRSSSMPGRDSMHAPARAARRQAEGAAAASRTAATRNGNGGQRRERNSAGLDPQRPACPAFLIARREAPPGQRDTRPHAADRALRPGLDRRHR